MVKNHYPLLCIDDLLDQLKNAIYFTKFYFHSGYQQVQIAERDVWKTTFKTKQGFFEWMVMPFGLCNTTATFMRVMNDLFRPFIDEFVLVYLDDILVFSKIGMNMRFVANFSIIAAPLHTLTSVKQVFQWGGNQQKSFESLKEKISTALVLALPDLQQPFKIETDVSEYAMGVVLVQQKKSICYHSKKFSQVLTNYPTYDKELYALV
eukprot:PITA_32025